MKLWGGRFKGEESKLMEDFNSSLHFDKRLFRQDIEGSIAHAKMLSKCSIISYDEGELIIAGLISILTEIESGLLDISGNYEDIHSFIEVNLIKKIGETGKKLHTARSRNDQVAVDTRLYAKYMAGEVIKEIENLQGVILEIGEKNHAIMPGYTHLQRAQIVTFKHHIMAYYEMFKRDKKRLLNSIDIMDESPLGCCALAGTTYDIDREFTAKELGFSKPVENYLDGVSDRDFLIELISDFSIIMMHLSRLSEELILWSSQEFKFVEISDAYATGSSIMPQKKNPDAAELIRGKTGRVYGSLISILTTMKGLPLAYNKDMQEDKEQFFNALNTVLSCLKVMASMLLTMKIKKDNMLRAVKKGFLNATEVADYLVLKGIPFRDAHKISGQIVIHCEEKGIAIEDMSLEEFKEIHELFEEDIYEFIDYDSILKRGIKKTM